MRVLVTGGAGFLAPHIAAELTSAGHKVILFDQRVPSTGDASVLGNLAELDEIVAAVAGVEGICHLGGVGDVYLALEEPYTAAAANVLGTTNVMEAARLNGVSKVVYASTWEVYGEPVYQPIDENHSCRPDHPYNITKLAGEQMVLAYDRLKGVPALALRLGTAYGRGMRPNSVFSLFIAKAKRGEPLTIKGSGLQSRQFTHTGDLAKAFRLALESPLHGEALNIVAREEISIQQLADMIAHSIPVDIIHEDARLGDVPSARISANRAQEKLGWTAEVPFVDGLADLIASHS